LSNASITFDAGTDIASAAKLAAGSDVAIVFATQWTTESADVPDLSLPSAQDALIAAVAEANPRTIVVLETGGPVKMPWLDRVGAVVEAWYSGSRGGEAIAGVLTGEVNPSGRLPITFPANEDQLPRPVLDSAPPRVAFDVDYFEGANVGYRWYAARHAAPLFPFGFGLSYTQFEYARLSLRGGGRMEATFDVTNAGTRTGAETAQVYAAQELENGRSIARLVGWTKVVLQPGEARRVTVAADPRLLAHFDPALGRWIVPKGRFAVTVGRFAGDGALGGTVSISARRLKP
jgi:beta-glucosidase